MKGRKMNSNRNEDVSCGTVSDTRVTGVPSKAGGKKEEILGESASILPPKFDFKTANSQKISEAARGS